MNVTSLQIKEKLFYINGKPTYSEIENCPQEYHGLLMNARFIQGIFDDKQDVSRFNRFGRFFDADKNTDDLINALPMWYAFGLRAITVGFQGGGACFTIPNTEVINNPFSSDGKSIDPAYLARMDRLIRAADRIGMVVIVSYFYGSQTRFLEGGIAVKNAVITASRFLKEGKYSNVIIEIANEFDLSIFSIHPIIQTGSGMSVLIDIAKKESGGLPVGSSLAGGNLNREVALVSDVVFFHGNGKTRQQLSNMATTLNKWCPNKPLVCNEDSQAISNLEVAWHHRFSWGYYNNLTKQEPPADWSINPGEDTFFATRIALKLGLPCEIPADKYSLLGLGENEDWNGKRWPRVASLYPETIDYVEFLNNGKVIDVCYDDPFAMGFESNWKFEGCICHPDDDWSARVFLRDGTSLKIRKKIMSANKIETK